MDYTTQADIEAQIKRVLTANELVMLPSWLAAVKAYIDSYTGSSFDTTPSLSTMYYPGGSKIIDIDPCTDISSVKLLDSSLTEVDTYILHEQYEALPQNDDIKTWLESRSGCFPAGLARIAVTAKFSLGALPDDIKFVATTLVSGMVVEGMNGKLMSEGIEGYSRAFAVSLASGELSTKKDIIDAILAGYIKDDILI